jgi:xylulokinase
MGINNKYILAIDLGTSGPKSALVSAVGEVIDYDFKETGIKLLPGGGAEQSPDEWWRAIKETSRNVIKRCSVPVEDITVISCSTQWSGTVAVDEHGNPLMAAVIWLDSRGSPYVKDMVSGIIRIEGYDVKKLWRWITLTGGAPSLSGKDPIAHILYIKHVYPEIYRATYKFLEPKDYINLRLTGKFGASFDSIALHWVTDNRNISRIRYDDRLIRMTGIEREKLPELKPASDILGNVKKSVAEALGLTTDVQVIMGTPDVQAAAIGSGAVQDFRGHLYIGTSSWITCHVPFKKTDLIHGIASLPSALPEKYFVANEQETAGACLTFLKDNILYNQDELLSEENLPDVYKIFDRIVSTTPPGSDRVIFTPWLYGERTPVENHSVRAGFFNLSLNTNRGHLIRAIFEGVAYNGKWLLKYVERFIKRPLDPIHMIGGGANSDIWCQIHADVFDRHIHQVKDPIQANVRGAALLGAMAMGYLTPDDIPECIQVAKIFSPNPDNRRIYDELFKEFLNIYKKNQEIYRRLNRKAIL